MQEPESLSLVTKRAEFLAALADRPLEKRELVDELGYSRATVNRAVGALEDADLVTDTGDGYEPTLAAALAVDRYREFVATGGDVLDATDVLAPLDHDADLSPALLRDAELYPADDHGTYGTFERVHGPLADADRLHVVVPATRALPAVDHWQDALVAADDATVVLDDALYESVRDDHRSLPWLAAQGVDVLSGDAPSYVLVRAERTGSAAGPSAETTASGEASDAGANTGGAVTFALAYDEDAGGFGAVGNDSRAAAEWAAETVDACLAAATDVSGEFEHASDPGEPARLGGPPAASLPRVLESEGFVALADEYFDTHPARDLATALRTGLTLADVREGHAIARTPEDDSPRETVAADLLAALSNGEDCAVVGEPGAGKSTVCKRVACEWYDRDRGPVLYRESGQGDPFESVASLRATLRDAPDDTLVVVEDAVRPEANAVMELATEYAGADDVHFLVDARASDWSENRLLPVDAAVREYKNAEMAVTTLSRPTAAECAALLDDYEADTGTTLDVTGDDLRDRIDEADAVSGGMFLLAHHVCLRADPVAATDDVTPSPLVEDVQERIRALERDAPDAAVGTALLAQFLNLAERPVHDEFLQAQAVDRQDLTPDAVRSALTSEQLVVDDPHRGLRTPHTQWSRVFLTEALDLLDDAPQRFGDALDAVLALTDEATRSALPARTRTSSLLQRIAADPTDWADDLAETLFRTGEDVPALKPYFGRFSNTAFDLRSHCSTSAFFDCSYRRGRMLSEKGDLEAAEAAFSTVIDAIEEREDPRRFDVQKADCLLMLGSVRGRQGHVEAYEELARRAQELHRENDNQYGVANCFLGLSQVAVRRNGYEKALEYNLRGVSLFDELGALERKARALRNASACSNIIEEYEQSERYARRSLALYQRLGKQSGLTACYNQLGRVAEANGQYEAALEYFEEGLAVADAIGAEQWRVHSLVNLGYAQLTTGDPEEAEECLNRALELNRTLGDPQQDGIIYENLSNLAYRRSDTAKAREYARAGINSLQQCHDEDVHSRLRVRLGQVALAEAEFETAREEVESALRTFEENGAERWVLRACLRLGRLERNVGDWQAASEYASRARELLDTDDLPKWTALTSSLNGQVHVGLGELESARECFAAAESVVEDVADTYLQAVVYRRLGEFEQSHGDPAVASERFERSRELAASIGAEAVVAAVDAAVDRDGSLSAPGR